MARWNPPLVTPRVMLSVHIKSSRPVVPFFFLAKYLKRSPGDTDSKYLYISIYISIYLSIYIYIYISI